MLWAPMAGISHAAEASRERQSLEAFALKQLRFVAFYPEGVSGAGCKPMASVRDPKGFLHHVFIGDYVGRHFGRVVEMSADGLRLLEAVKDAQGEWVQREAWLRARS